MSVLLCARFACMPAVPARAPQPAHKLHAASCFPRVQRAAAVTIFVGATNQYKITVTPFGKNNAKGPAASIFATMPCNGLDAPGSPVGLTATPVPKPPGQINLAIRDITNKACVAAWEVRLLQCNAAAQDALIAGDCNVPSAGQRMRTRAQYPTPQHDHRRLSSPATTRPRRPPM